MAFMSFSSKNRRQQRLTGKMRGEIVADELAHGLACFDGARGVVGLQKNIVQREKTRIELRLAFEDVERR